MRARVPSSACVKVREVAPVVRRVRTKSPQTADGVPVCRLARESAKLGALSPTVSVQPAEPTAYGRAFSLSCLRFVNRVESWRERRPLGCSILRLLASEVFTASPRARHAYVYVCVCVCVCICAREYIRENVRDGRDRPTVYTCRRRIESGKECGEIIPRYNGETCVYRGLEVIGCEFFRVACCISLRGR